MKGSKVLYSLLVALFLMLCIQLPVHAERSVKFTLDYGNTITLEEPTFILVGPKKAYIYSRNLQGGDIHHGPYTFPQTIEAYVEWSKYDQIKLVGAELIRYCATDEEFEACVKALHSTNKAVQSLDDETILKLVGDHSTAKPYKPDPNAQTAVNQPAGQAIATQTKTAVPTPVITQTREEAWIEFDNMIKTKTAERIKEEREKKERELRDAAPQQVETPSRIPHR